MTDRRGSLLAHLRGNSRATATEVAEALGVAAVTARHHLARLRAEGLVESVPVRAGRGRPRYQYRLTSLGAATVVGPRPLAVVVAGLIDVLRDDDPGAATRALRASAVRLAAAHRDSLSELPIERRLDAVVDLLARAGFTAAWSRDRDGYLITEADCPFGDLSEAYDEVCHLDMELLRQLVGTEIRRECWRGAGHSGCSFRIVDPCAEGSGPSPVAETG